MAVTKRTRYEVLRRDNNTCRYCGGTAPDVKITVDHVTPVALGGTDKPENLVAACWDCNAGKSSVPPGADLVADVSQTALRWSGAIKKAAEIKGAQVSKSDNLIEWFELLWDIHAPQFAHLPSNWRESIVNFVAAGLTLDAIEEAVHTTASKGGYVQQSQMFRYFCGICWSKVRELQEIAVSLLTAEDA